MIKGFRPFTADHLIPGATIARHYHATRGRRLFKLFCSKQLNITALFIQCYGRSTDMSAGYLGVLQGATAYLRHIILHVSFSAVTLYCITAKALDINGKYSSIAVMSAPRALRNKPDTASRMRQFQHREIYARVIGKLLQLIHNAQYLSPVFDTQNALRAQDPASPHSRNDLAHMAAAMGFTLAKRGP